MAQSLFNGPHVAGDVSLTFVGRYISQLSVQATAIGTGNVSGQIIIEGSNTGNDWVPVAQLTVSGSGRATDGGMAQTNWEFLRARIVSLSADSVVCSMLTQGFHYGT